MTIRAPRQRFLAPEVVQSSAMDCGPASLKCLLEGFGIPVSYGRLREACQTDVDGTSIDTLEQVANQLGLDATQIMIPTDHLLLAEAGTLPALVVVRLANGVTHFVVLWRTHGPLLQIMDPATGRRWTTHQHFLDELYIHTMPVPAADWREWAGSDEFLRPLRRRLTDLRLPDERATHLIETALEDPTWTALATLDAATRTVAAIVQAGGLQRAQEADGIIAQLITRVRDGADAIPSSYWCVRPAPPAEDEAGNTIEQVYLRGAVLVRVRGLQSRPTDQSQEVPADASEALPLSPELVAALAEPPSRPGWELLRLLRADGLLMPLVLIVTLWLAAGGVVIEALLLRSLIDLGNTFGLFEQRLSALAAIILFIVALLLLELPAAFGFLRIGRRLEARLRIALFAKIPRLSDRYFQSRLPSDMAERAHMTHMIRLLPHMGGQLLQTVFMLLFTTGGIIWLNPDSTPLALLSAAAAMGLPLLCQSLLKEGDLRVRTHAGALSHFVFDALIGLVAIRAHSAERAIRREHERLLAEWVRASRSLLAFVVAVEGMQMLAGFGLAAWLLVDYLNRSSPGGGALLLVYWALRLPIMGQEIALLAQQYPGFHNITLRLLEPLGALEEHTPTHTDTSTPPFTPPSHAEGEQQSIAESHLVRSPVSRPASESGVAITFTDVSIRAAGHTLLEEINLHIPASSHIAIVGPSGAGKSSLVGLLLGWHRPATGHIEVDNLPLDGPQLAWLRQHTAWVDPAIQLWNRTLLDNVCYGIPDHQYPPLGPVLVAANLREVLEKLPDGLQSSLGEGGGLLSGGEGQRVRLGRAMLRPAVRLVILDEPFRGLDREQRHILLTRARKFWQGATLLCISHDVCDTQMFDRVLVVEQGHIVEDDAPANLASDPDSRFRALLDAESEVRAGLWRSSVWRRLRIEQGQLHNDSQREEQSNGRSAAADLANATTE